MAADSHLGMTALSRVTLASAGHSCCTVVPRFFFVLTWYRIRSSRHKPSCMSGSLLSNYVQTFYDGLVNGGRLTRSIRLRVFTTAGNLLVRFNSCILNSMCYKWRVEAICAWLSFNHDQDSVPICTFNQSINQSIVVNWWQQCRLRVN